MSTSPQELTEAEILGKALGDETPSKPHSPLTPHGFLSRISSKKTDKQTLPIIHTLEECQERNFNLTNEDGVLDLIKHCQFLLTSTKIDLSKASAAETTLGKINGLSKNEDISAELKLLYLRLSFFLKMMLEFYLTDMPPTEVLDLSEPEQAKKYLEQCHNIVSQCDVFIDQKGYPRFKLPSVELFAQIRAAYKSSVKLGLDCAQNLKIYLDQIQWFFNCSNFNNNNYTQHMVLYRLSVHQLKTSLGEPQTVRHSVPSVKK